MMGSAHHFKGAFSVIFLAMPCLCSHPSSLTLRLHRSWRQPFFSYVWEDGGRVHEGMTMQCVTRHDTPRRNARRKQNPVCNWDFGTGRGDWITDNPIPSRPAIPISFFISS
ncbi:uncharacterized protein P884DRAFT_260273 [Thermothelomyces heterothallicus CBS 202.75]|uniref:uncharacterized protein n=1 Tax=Thermothelomyces heterothallicus CBS 202.75 TaxID=1149848 RepID=UPI0037434446